MAKFIVTGASGYIGGYVANHLDELGHEVIAPIRSGSSHILNPGISIISGDLWEISTTACQEIATDATLVHLAWQDGFIHNADSHLGQLSNHYNFVLKLISSGLTRFVGLGSMHELGPVSGLVSEDSVAVPVNQYGIAKNALRNSLRNLCEQWNIEYLWLRCFYILGDDHKNKSVFSKMLELEAEHAEYMPLTSGSARFDFIEVRDLAVLIAQAAQNHQVTGILNLGSGEVVSLRERIERFKTENKIQLELKFGVFPERTGIGEGAWPDLTRMNELLN